MSNKIFKIEIVQPKFDELYRSYENRFQKKKGTQTATKNSTSLTTTKEKLGRLRGRVDNTASFDKHFKELIGIELFDFIQTNDILKNEFDKRVNYLKNLSEDNDFNELQDNLFNVIQEILKLISLEEVEKRQKEWGNKIINKLKRKNRLGGEEKDFLTLPELYTNLQNKENYYRLGDRSYFSPEEGEISIITHTVPVKKQYKVNVERFFELVFFEKFAENKGGRAKLEELLKEYNEYWYKLDELIYRIPIQKHFKSFEWFFLTCLEFHPREGYESHYNFFSGSTNRDTEKHFKKIKDGAITVIDDLLEELELQERAVEGLNLTSNQLDVFVKQFTAITTFQEELRKMTGGGAVEQLQETVNAQQEAFRALTTSMGPLLSTAQEVHKQIGHIDFSSQAEQLRQIIERWGTSASELKRLTKTINLPMAYVVTPKKEQEERTGPVIVQETDNIIATQLTELVTIVRDIDKKLPPLSKGETKKISLKGKTIQLDETKPAITVDSKICSLPPATNEEYLAKAVFSHLVGEFVDWSIIHKEMTGDSEVIGSEREKRAVRDTMYRLNKRIKETIGTNDELLSWRNKSICRNY